MNEFDIEETKHTDADINDITIVENPKSEFFGAVEYHVEDDGTFTFVRFQKEDAINLAKHFKLTESDLS